MNGNISYLIKTSNQQKELFKEIKAGNIFTKTISHEK